MKNNLKKIVSIFLMVALLIGLVPMNSFAALAQVSADDYDLEHLMPVKVISDPSYTYPDSLKLKGVASSVLNRYDTHIGNNLVEGSGGYGLAWSLNLKDSTSASVVFEIIADDQMNDRYMGDFFDMMKRLSGQAITQADYDKLLALYERHKEVGPQIRELVLEGKEVYVRYYNIDLVTVIYSSDFTNEEIEMKIEILNQYLKNVEEFESGITRLLNKPSYHFANADYRSGINIAKIILQTKSGTVDYDKIDKAYSDLEDACYESSNSAQTNYLDELDANGYRLFETKKYTEGTLGLYSDIGDALKMEDKVFGLKIAGAKLGLGLAAQPVLDWINQKLNDTTDARVSSISKLTAWDFIFNMEGAVMRMTNDITKAIDLVYNPGEMLLGSSANNFVAQANTALLGSITSDLAATAEHKSIDGVNYLIFSDELMSRVYPYLDGLRNDGYEVIFYQSPSENDQVLAEMTKEFQGTSAANKSMALTNVVQVNAQLVAKLSPNTEMPALVYFRIGDKIALANGKLVDMKTAAIVKNGRTLVPIRFIAENLNCQVGWDEKTQVVTIKGGSNVMTLKINSNVAQVDGKNVNLDQAAEIINGSTMVPLRFVSESFHKNVFWDGENNKVVVYDSIK